MAKHRNNHTGQRLQELEAAKKFMLAGKATFTIKSASTGARKTYRVVRHKDYQRGTRLWFVYVKLSNSFEYIGIIGSSGFFRWTQKARLAASHELVKGFIFVLSVLCGRKPASYFIKFEFWHVGRCARCGRPLTTPESIKLGFGEVCRKEASHA